MDETPEHQPELKVPHTVYPPPQERVTHRYDGYHGHVDGLRAVAVIAVILFHLHVAGITGGFVGVDVFFTISGFVITEMIQRLVAQGKFSFGYFYERRVRRIIPGLLVLLFLASVMATLMLSAPDLVFFAKSMGASVLLAANIFFYGHSGYFDKDVDNKPLLHLWSLGVEGQFYLIWPLLLVLVLRRNSMRSTWTMIIVPMLLSLGISITGAQLDQANGAFYLLPSRIFEFLIGGALVWLPTIRTSREYPFADVIFILGLAMIAAGILTYDEHTPFPSFYALLPCLGAAMVIHGGHDAGLRRLLNNRVMVYLGRISYELYLFHWPAIVYFKYLSDDKLSLGDDALLIFITFVLSALTYQFVTRPLRYGFSKTTTQRHNVLLALLVACVVLLGSAMSMKITDGWPWRIPPEARLFVHDPGAFHQANYGGAGIWDATQTTLGDTTQPPQFLLFGDSFAAQYAWALDAFLKEHHESAYLYHVSGCLIMPHVYAYGPGNTYPRCTNAFAKVQELLKGNTLPVIQAQSWTSYKGIIHNNDGSLVPFDKNTNEGYYHFMMDAVEKSRQTFPGHRYLFVGVSPGISEQKSLARCFIVPTYLPNKCAQGAAAKEEDRPNGLEFNMLAADYLKTHPEVTFINPRTAMCHDGLCYAISENKIFYSDYSHFTKDGARVVVDKYQDVILSLHPGATASATGTQP